MRIQYPIVGKAFNTRLKQIETPINIKLLRWLSKYLEGSLCVRHIITLWILMGMPWEEYSSDPHIIGEGTEAQREVTCWKTHSWNMASWEFRSRQPVFRIYYARVHFLALLNHLHAQTSSFFWAWSLWAVRGLPSWPPLGQEGMIQEGQSASCALTMKIRTSL